MRLYNIPKYGKSQSHGVPLNTTLHKQTQEIESGAFISSEISLLPCLKYIEAGLATPNT